MNKEKALDILKNPSIIQKDPDAVIVDDHRWTHMWAKTLSRHDNLFLTESELIKLHGIYVDEFKRRGLNHDSPLEFSLHMGGDLEAIISHRKEIPIDPEFISVVGSSVGAKESPNDIDLLVKATASDELRNTISNGLLSDLPDELKKRVEYVWQPSGPNGPSIPLFSLKAVPIEQIAYKEPHYHMSPMAPYPPPTPRALVTNSDLPDLLEDSYYVLPAEGMRLIVHRRENQVMAFDAEQDEYELPDVIQKEILSIQDPKTFILDCLLSNDKSSLAILDMPWWRDSEHYGENTEVRHHFIGKLEEKPHLSRKGKYFSNRRDAIAYLKEETGPNILIPGSTAYPINGEQSEWLLYQQRQTLKLSEAADAEIKKKIDDGAWESMPADKRFSLMTRRQGIEPLYPFAQLKTIKKGYSQREVFGMKSVGTLAKELFNVPNKISTEVKVDGFRTQIHKLGDRVRIFTESGHEITQRLPKVVESVKSIPAQSFVVDAEGTPYDEELTNMGRGGAAPAFAEGAHEPFDDSRFALHVFDILYLDGKDVHDLPYEERRKILHGLELPVRDVPKDQGDFRNHLWENNVYWATSAEQLNKLAGQVSKVSGSEGAMFKQADSKYRLSGSTPLWSKMKNTFDIDAIVVGVKKEGGVYNYVGAIGPVTISDTSDAEQAPIETQKGAKFVKWKGKVYSVLGKTFNTKLEAKLGDIIRVTVKDIAPIDNNLYHWFHPQVLEVREDKTRPDPCSTAEAISKTARGQQKTVVNEAVFDTIPQKRAFLVNSRYGEASAMACCMSSWVAVDGADGYQYLANGDDVYKRLSELGVTDIYGTRMEREPMEKLMEANIEFHQVPEGLLGALHLREITLEPEHPKLALSDLPLILEFQNENPEKLEGYSGMKLSCGSFVPLDPLKLQENAYLTNPDEAKSWRFVAQMHVRGLSVHTDFRAQIDKGTLIGWTWDLGKSLIKPMLRRLSDVTLGKANITRGDIKELPIKDLSAKIRSTPEGRKLLELLTQKTQELPSSSLKTMLNELWKEEVEPILKDPNRKIMTQKKGTMSTAWLDEEGEIKPGMVGATSELEGQIFIMDRGTVEYGAQKSYFNEYWLHGDKLNGRVLVRRLTTRPEWNVKESFSWLTFFPKPEEKPYTISRRAVQQNWYPPKGVSALPRKVREQIPNDYRYWVASSTSHEMRDALVDEVTKRKVVLKLSAKTAQFTVKRVWHKGPEVQRGLPVVRYWLLLHDGNKVLDAWDFGLDTDPTVESGVTARRREVGQMTDLLPTSGELPASHPASETKQLTNHFDTVDSGAVSFQMDKNNILQLKLDGGKLKGSYVFVREDPSSEMWVFNKAEMNERLKSLKLSCDCLAQVGLEENAADYKTEVKGDVLIISGPAIKPGEWIPGNTGKPNYFTKEGIKKFWTQAPRKPIGVYHGPLKGDVVGYVDKVAYNDATGEGRIVRAVIWHPVAIALILQKKLLAFSIEIVPQTVWDPEHQHDHIIDGTLLSVDLVPQGACRTCNIDSAVFGSTKPGNANQVYKFGLTLPSYLQQRYWAAGLSTQEIADKEGIPRSTVEHYMEEAGIPRRDLREARALRNQKEAVLKLGGKTSIIAIGSGSFNKLPVDECAQCKEYSEGGLSRRNHAATLFTNGGEQLLINAPKGIFSLLSQYNANPKFVVVEHQQALGGLHELRALSPMVAASQETWDYLRQNYKEISGQEGRFEDIYTFPRFILRPGTGIVLGKGRQFKVVPVAVDAPNSKAIGFKIQMDGHKIWHSSTVSKIPDAMKVLKDTQIYIGDGSNPTSIEEQLGWLKEADSLKGIYFTQIGHVEKSHKDFANWLSERDAKSQPLYDGAEINLTASSPSAILPKQIAEKVANGDVNIILRAKPYQEYSKQVIYLVGGNEIIAIMVEGLPEGPISSKEAKALEHGMNEAEWKRMVGNSDKVWVYHPKIIKRYESPREIELNPKSLDFYLPETRLK